MSCQNRKETSNCRCSGEDPEDDVRAEGGVIRGGRFSPLCCDVLMKTMPVRVGGGTVGQFGPLGRRINSTPV